MIALNNLASLDGLTISNAKGSLLVEEVNRKNTDNNKGQALVMHGRQVKEKEEIKVQRKSKSCNAHEKSNQLRNRELSLWKDWSHEMRLSKMETRKRQRQSIKFRGQEEGS